jgi:hypothetical protein
MENILKLSYSLIQALGPNSRILHIKDLNDTYFVEQIPEGMFLSSLSETVYDYQLFSIKQLMDMLKNVFYISINNGYSDDGIVLYQGTPGRENKRKNDRENDNDNKRQAIDDLNFDRMNLFGQTNINPKEIIKIVTQLIDIVPGLELDIYTDPVHNAEYGYIYYIEKKNNQFYMYDESGETDQAIHSMEEMYSLIKGTVVILTIIQRPSSKNVKSLSLYNTLNNTSFGKSGNLKNKYLLNISNEIKYLLKIK